MMSYHTRIREIMSNFVMGYQDRETCITMFEELLHEYGLLPVEEQLDRTITNENFIALLKMAREHKDPKSNRDPEASKECIACQSGECLEHKPDKKKTPGEHFLDSLQQINHLIGGPPANYSLAETIKQRCPVCMQPAAGLFNRLQGMNNEVLPVDPPRCQACMMKWVEERFGTGAHSKIAQPHPSFTPDGTTPTPLSPTEFEFFQQYESEMEGFKP